MFLLSENIADIISFAAEYLFTVWFFSRFERKTNRGHLVLGCLILLLIGYLFLPIFNLPEPIASEIMMRSAVSFLRQICRMLIHLIPVFLFVFLTKEIHMSQALYLSGLFTCLYLLIQNIRSALRLIYRLSVLSESTPALITYIAIALEALCILLVLKTLDLRYIVIIDRYRWIMMSIAILLSLYVKWTLRTNTANIIFDLQDKDAFPFALLSSVGIFGILLFFESSRQAQEKQKAAELEQIRLGYEIRSAKRMMQSGEDIKRLYHDMKNHLLAIQSMSDKSDDINEYLSQLLPLIDGYESQVLTGNPIVDSLLSEKIQRTVFDGIQFNVCMDLTGMSDVKPVDLVAIFGNAADNAIEAVRDLPADKSRIIYLKSNRFANMITIRFSNQFADIPEIKDGLPVTHKEDKAMHGIGLSSIKTAAERYGGSISIDVDREGGWFNLIVMIPASNVSKAEQA